MSFTRKLGIGSFTAAKDQTVLLESTGNAVTDDPPAKAQKRLSVEDLVITKNKKMFLSYGRGEVPV
jgi:hypothetical protein